MRLFNIPSGHGFLDALAIATLRRTPPEDAAFSRQLFLLPTRRAARALAEAFLRATGGQVLLLPRIMAVGAPDEAGLMLAHGLELPPPFSPAARTAILARAVLATGRAGLAPGALDQAWRLAAELGQLLDEAALAEVDLAAVLPGLAGGEFAAHWERTRLFLEVLTQQWPAILAESGRLDPGAHLAQLLAAQAQAWMAAPPGRVIAAGFAGAPPVVAGVLRAVLALPEGEVVLAGFCGPDHIGERLPPTHPQAGLSLLLRDLGCEPAAVQPLPCLPDVPADRAARAETLRLALLPAERMGEWQGAPRAGLEGVSLIAANDAQAEARAIALALRGGLEQGLNRTALVTPDRDLATRVLAELRRFGILADDSAGQALAATPAAVFLRLTAEAASLHPVPLLAWAKHPLAGLGMRRAALRRAVRTLERKVLRGPRPPADLAAFAARGGQAELLERIGRCLAPLQALGPRAAPGDALPALILAAERAAAYLPADDSDGEDEAAEDAAPAEVPGAIALWQGREGEALAGVLTEALASLAGMAAVPPLAVADLPLLLDALLAGAVTPRAPVASGSAQAIDPRVAIWGMLEARGQSADLMVLGGLAEGVWPAVPDSGPWLSNEMRKRAGLAPIETAIGAAAEQFFAAACAAPRVVLSWAKRRDGAPAVPSRFLMRLTAFAGDALAAAPEAAWAAALDSPAEAAQPLDPPAPCPPVALRPRRLSVTEAAKLHRDPYAIYARHVLGLRELDPLDAFADAATFGNLVHSALSTVRWPDDEAGWRGLRGQLAAAMDHALAQFAQTGAVRPALAAWWRPRLMRIADWVAAEGEPEWRAAGKIAEVRNEIAGSLSLDAPFGPFELRGRADRIERRADGGFGIVDYKTATAPGERDAVLGREPQLLLEAAMLKAGAFGVDFQGVAAVLGYWRLTGGHPPGEISVLFKRDPDRTQVEADDALDNLRRLIAMYDDPATAYAATAEAAAGRFVPYARLMRAAEWAAGDPDGEVG